ncbi:hypothetical protein QR680_000530 [Steinernema hermaphroditum]|uniref:PHD-type domain-containing protein n=1 Tax=Steinernema hermaphroditum TaxID=289476 RepID=A0AA39GUW4_9BILA|nr:hypothetical protein QR680_000530 [Steinernema hermaphroditum]
MSVSKELYCICRGPHGDRDMVQCEKCEEWYHWDCIGFTQEQADDDFCCAKCLSAEKITEAKAEEKPKPEAGEDLVIRLLENLGDTEMVNCVRQVLAEEQKQSKNK